MKDGAGSVGAGDSGRASVQLKAGRDVRTSAARDLPAPLGARGHGAGTGKGTFAEALARVRSTRVTAPPGREGGGAPRGMAESHGGRARSQGARRGDEDARSRREDDPLDPSARRAAQLAPPPQPIAPPAAISPAAASAAAERSSAPASLETLLPGLVKRIAWSGDGRRGTVRLELGAGALAGATLLIQSSNGKVDVQIAAPAGVDAKAWGERIARRLEERGLDVGSVVSE